MKRLRLRRRTLGDAFDPGANNFDLLRLVLAASVVVSHCCTLLGHRDPLMWLTGNQVTLGGVAVDGFFILSGFLIARSWENSRGIGDYLGRRARRIYPAFIGAGLFCVLVVGPLASTDPITAHGWRNIRRLLTLGEPIMPHIYAHTMAAGHPNPVVWSIRYEFLCYVLVPLLSMAGVARHPSRALWLFAALYVDVAVWYGLRGFCPDAPRVLSCFASGATFWLRRWRAPLSPGLISASIALLALGCWRGFAVAVPIAGAYLLFAAALRPGRLNRAAKSGDLSYGIYLYGFPIQMLVTQAFHGRIAPCPLAFITLLSAALCAFASWHLIEKRFLRTRGRTARATSDYGESRERTLMSRNAAEV